jgi:hypothetical protein
MTMQKLLEKFHHTVVSGDPSPVIASVKKHPRLTPEQQLAIYSDGYVLRLLSAVRADYPALLALLGESEFERLAREYIRQTPSVYYNLDFYPHDFADFVVAQHHQVFVCEVAQLEQAIARVFMMEESIPLSSAALEGLTMEKLAALVLRPRAASQLLAFSYPVSEWLDRQRADGTKDVPQMSASYVYVYRHNNEVQRVKLSEPAYCVLREIISGTCIGDALDAVADSHPEMVGVMAAELQGWLSYWIADEFFALPQV